MLKLMNEPAFIEYVADRGLRTESDAALYLAEKILPSYEKFGFGLYRVDLKDSESAIGICGLLKRDTLDDPDVGFSILNRFCRKGMLMRRRQRCSITDAQFLAWRRFAV